ncbi:MAG: hypothetical protein WD066_13940 [Planctomycetaceae bacterium]
MPALAQAKAGAGIQRMRESASCIVAAPAWDWIPASAGMTYAVAVTASQVADVVHGLRDLPQ